MFNQINICSTYHQDVVYGVKIKRHTMGTIKTLVVSKCIPGSLNRRSNTQKLTTDTRSGDEFHLSVTQGTDSLLRLRHSRPVHHHYQERPILKMKMKKTTNN